MPWPAGRALARAPGAASRRGAGGAHPLDRLTDGPERAALPAFRPLRRLPRCSTLPPEPYATSSAPRVVPPWRSAACRRDVGRPSSRSRRRASRRRAARSAWRAARRRGCCLGFRQRGSSRRGRPVTVAARSPPRAGRRRCSAAGARPAPALAPPARGELSPDPGRDAARPAAARRAAGRLAEPRAAGGASPTRSISPGVSVGAGRGGAGAHRDPPPAAVRFGPTCGRAAARRLPAGDAPTARRELAGSGRANGAAARRSAADLFAGLGTLSLPSPAGPRRMRAVELTPRPLRALRPRRRRAGFPASPPSARPGPRPLLPAELARLRLRRPRPAARRRRRRRSEALAARRRAPASSTPPAIPAASPATPHSWRPRLAARRASPDRPVPLLRRGRAGGPASGRGAAPEQALIPPPPPLHTRPRRCPLRLAVQDVALSRRKQGFESPRGRQAFQALRALRRPARPLVSKIPRRYPSQNVAGARPRTARASPMARRLRTDVA